MGSKIHTQRPSTRTKEFSRVLAALTEKLMQGRNYARVSQSRRETWSAGDSRQAQ